MKNITASHALPRLTPLSQALRQLSFGLSALTVLAALAPAPAWADTAAAAATRHTVQLPAGQLATTLARYAADVGVILAFDAQWLAGRQSPALSGQFTVAEGFARLLAATPYRAEPVAGQRYQLVLRPASTAEGEPATLAPVVVTAPLLRTPEKLDQQMLQLLPAANGDLTSQLRINPNIQFDEAQLSSATGGEISPAEISIHGAKPYQNEMLVDGLSIANDLDPGNKIVTTNPEYIPGQAQALAYDSSQLCNARVLDNNVPAEYGRFTGGVVEAELCRARKTLGGSVSIGYTSSAWSEQIIDPRRQSAFEKSSDADNQPRYRKWTYKANVEARPSEDWGVVVSAVRRESEIPLKRFSSDNSSNVVSQEVTQTRRMDSLAIKADWSPKDSPHSGDITFSYAPSENGYFIADAKDSDYQIRSGGTALSGRLVSELGKVTLNQQLSLMQNEQSRRSDVDYYRAWRWSTAKNWGDASESNPTSLEGAWGDVDQTLRTVNYKLAASFDLAGDGALSHKIGTGIDLKHQTAEYERLSTTRYWLTPANLPTSGAMASCQYADGSVDTEGCSATATLAQGRGQYFRRLITYQAGGAEMEALSSAAYIDDQMRWQDWQLRLGLRADHDTLTRDLNLAPRSSLTWQAAPGLSLNAGANRYYGRSLLAYALQDQIHTLQYTQTRTTSSLVWSSPVQSKTTNRLSDIDSPYDDEATLGISWEPDWAGGPFDVRLTRRDGKQQIVKRLVTGQTECASNQCYVYTNQGSSQTRDFTLSWTGRSPWRLGNSRTSFWLAFNNSDVKSNYSSYVDTYSSDKAADEIIQYDGQFIRYSDMPADNYNRPWTLRLGAITSLPAYSLSISNLLRIRDGYQQMLQDGTTTYEGSTVDVWRKTALPRSLTLDTVVAWNPRISGSQRAQVKLSIENVTNRKNMLSVSDSYATYERGRTFTLELGYQF